MKPKAKKISEIFHTQVQPCSSGIVRTVTNKEEVFYVDKSKEGSPTRFSLYTTEKPFTELLEHKEHAEACIHTWQTDSRYAYLQEPEWKVGEKIIYFPTKGEHEVVEIIKVDKITVGNDRRIVYHNNIKGITRSRPIEMFSHFYPGQEVPSSAISYVRKVPIKSKPKKTGREVWKIEKEKNLSKQEYKQLLIDNYLIVKKEWKPAPEPPLNHMSPGQDDYAQWLKDLSSGTVQAVINQ